MKKRQQKKQSGFTLIEMLLVVGLIGILAAVIIPNLGNDREAATYGLTEQYVSNNIPKAINKHRMYSNNCTGLAIGDLTNRGLEAATPYGDNVAITAATATTVTMSIPLTSSTNAADAGAGLVAELTGKPYINGTPTYTAGTSTVSAVYLCN